MHMKRSGMLVGNFFVLTPNDARKDLVQAQFVDP